MEKCNSYVYIHWRPDTEEIFYVGKGTGDRYKFSKKRNPHHSAVVKKLRSLGLEPEIHIIKRNMPSFAALEFEMLLISMCKSIGHKLTNLTDGGGGPSNPSPETREKMRAAKIGKKKTDESRNKATKGLRNFFANWTEEDRRKRSETSKRVMQNPELKNKAIENLAKYTKCPKRIAASAKTRKGMEISEDQKERLRKLRLGQKDSPETRAKKSAAGMGRVQSQSKKNAISEKWTDERREQLINRNRAPVVCINNGLEYPSAKIAGEMLDCDLSSILKVCKGKLQKTKGLVFKYADKEPKTWLNP